MELVKSLFLFFSLLNEMVYLFAGIGIGYMAALAIYEYCNHGRMSENDLLRWENSQLLNAIEAQKLAAARLQGGDGPKTAHHIG